MGGGVDRPSVQLVPVRKYPRFDSNFIRLGGLNPYIPWVALKQFCCGDTLAMHPGSTV